jgi:hypothetical protein
MARINVSISDDLKCRMDEVEDEGVNWSALAAQAFESKLAELVTQRGARSLREVIARLRAAKYKDRHGASARGRAAGIAWASNVAQPEHLETLDELVNSGGEDYFADAPDQDYPPAERFYYEVIEPDHEGDRRVALRWWSQNFEGLDESGPCGTDVTGFAEGALTIWEQVRDEI